MRDEKRQIRKLKRELKRAGTKKRRRFLKNLSANPGDFEFGAARSDVLNEPKRQEKQAAE